MTRTPRLALPLLLGLATALPLTAAMASPDDTYEGRHHGEWRGDGDRSLASAKIDAAAAVAAVRSAGYSAVYDLEWEYGYWKVKARDAEGRYVRLRVDATSGDVARRAHH